MSRKRSASRAVGSLIDAAASEPTQSSKEIKSATYRIRVDQINRINELSDEWRFQKAALVCYLLDYAFEGIEKGDLDLSPKLLKKRPVE